MRVLMVTQWYPPEPGPARVPAVIAKGLQKRNADVTVLTGFPNYPAGTLQEGWKIRPLHREERSEAVTLRVPLIPSHGKGALGRLVNYASFGLSAALAYPLLRVSRQLKKPDVMWLSYSPVTVGLTQMVAQAVDKTPTVVWVGDLWPDTVGVSGIEGARGISRIAGPILHWWCNTLYRTASAVVVISPGVADVLESRGVPRRKIHFIPVTPDESIFHMAEPEREKWNFPQNRRVLVYAGAMGAAQELSTLISAAAQAGDAGPLIVIAGSGTAEAELKEQSDKLDAPVRFLSRVPETSMSSLLASADAAFIGLADAPLSAITMPSKTQSLLASGKPIVCCAEGDVTNVVQGAQCGWVTRPGNVAQLEAALRELAISSERELEDKREGALSAFREKFQGSTVGDAYESLLNTVANGGEEIIPPTAEITAVRGFNVADAPELAKLHKKAFPEFFLSSLGVPFLSRFYRGFAQDETGVSVVYRRQGRIIGVAVGTTQPEGFYSRLLKRDFLGLGFAAARAAVRNPKAIKRLLRGLTYRGNEAETSENQGLLASICLDPAERGQGIGTSLTRDFIEAMRDAGASSVVLTTDADNNEGVNRLYVRSGWELQQTSTTPEGRKMNHYAYSL